MSTQNPKTPEAVMEAGHFVVIAGASFLTLFMMVVASHPTSGTPASRRLDKGVARTAGLEPVVTDTELE